MADNKRMNQSSDPKYGQQPKQGAQERIEPNTADAQRQAQDRNNMGQQAGRDKAQAPIADPGKDFVRKQQDDEDADEVDTVQLEDPEANRVTQRNPAQHDDDKPMKK